MIRKKPNEERPKRVKKKKGSSTNHRKSSSSSSSSRRCNQLNASGSFISQDSSSQVSVCSTSASSYSPIMGAPLSMISQNHIVSPNVPLVCAYPNVICETRHYYLPSVAHPIDHLSTATTPTTGFIHPDGNYYLPSVAHPIDHLSTATTPTPGFIHPDGSVHYPLQLPPTSTLDCDSHHSISTHTEKTSNIKRYNMNNTNS